MSRESGSFFIGNDEHESFTDNGARLQKTEKRKEKRVKRREIPYKKKNILIFL